MDQLHLSAAICAAVSALACADGSGASDAGAADAEALDAAPLDATDAGAQCSCDVGPLEARTRTIPIARSPRVIAVIATRGGELIISGLAR